MMLSFQTLHDQTFAVFPTTEHCIEVTKLDLLRFLLAMTSSEDCTQWDVNFVFSNGAWPTLWLVIRLSKAICVIVDPNITTFAGSFHHCQWRGLKLLLLRTKGNMLNKERCLVEHQIIHTTFAFLRILEQFCSHRILIIIRINGIRLALVVINIHG